MKKPPDLVCRCCGNLFSPARKWQLHCSLKCRNDYHSKLRRTKYEEVLKELEELRLRNDKVKRELKNVSKTAKQIL